MYNIENDFAQPVMGIVDHSETRMCEIENFRASVNF